MASNPRITIVIPVRGNDEKNEGYDIAGASLAAQTYQDFKLVVVPDQGKGAPWARNEGFKQCDTEFVLFSDNDISWKSHALDTMLAVLSRTPRAAYCYGRYQIGELIVGHHFFDPARLLCGNYISTMSLLRSADFHGFDESLKKFQDWDLWLTLLLKHQKRGVYCNDLIFTTEVKPGITWKGDLTAQEGLDIINQKHKLNLPEFSQDFVKS